MIRIILTIALFSFLSANIIAQVESVFISKKEISWLNQEVSKYKSALDGLSIGYDKKDMKILTDNKNILKRSITRLEKNGLIIYKKIDSKFDTAKEQEKQPTLKPEGSEEYHRARIAKQEKEAAKRSEVALSEKDADAFLENIANIKNLSDQLTNDSFIVYPNNESSKVTLEKLEMILTHATAANDLIQTKIVN